MERFIAIVNPAAGGGRSKKRVGPALSYLRQNGLSVDVIASTGPGHAAQLAREAYDQGYRRFIAVGGDGTAHEIVNGLFSEPSATRRVSMGFLPLGTGNSFLRDFSPKGADFSLEALTSCRKRSVDVLRLTHSQGEVFSLNLVSIGFTADVTALTNRSLKAFGHLGYLLGVFARVAQLPRCAFKFRCDDDQNWDTRACLFLTFNNTKYTGGTMLIAPQADPSDGLIEFVRCGPVSRLELLRTLPRIYDGSHMTHRAVSRRPVRSVQFDMIAPVDVMIDGEIASLECRRLAVIPNALDIYL